MVKRLLTEAIDSQRDWNLAMSRRDKSTEGHLSASDTESSAMASGTKRRRYLTFEVSEQKGLSSERDCNQLRASSPRRTKTSLRVKVSIRKLNSTRASNLPQRQNRVLGLKKWILDLGYDDLGVLPRWEHEGSLICKAIMS